MGTPGVSMGGALRKGNFTDSQSQLFLEVFAFFDQDNNGYIELEELFIVFGNLGVEVTKEELKQKIYDVDVERNGKVSIFDSDGNGEIDIDELDTMMKKLGQELESDQIKEMIKAADIDRDGKISWDEFKKFMQSPN